MFALFSLGGGEQILVLALILILLWTKYPPDITRGFGRGFLKFRKHAGTVTKGLDKEAHDAGESLGGIYGRPAAQALTPDNRVAELYDPAVFQKPRTSKHPRFRDLICFCRVVWRRVCECSSFCTRALLS